MTGRDKEPLRRSYSHLSPRFGTSVFVTGLVSAFSLRALVLAVTAGFRRPVRLADFTEAA